MNDSFPATCPKCNSNRKRTLLDSVDYTCDTVVFDDLGIVQTAKCRAREQTVIIAAQEARIATLTEALNALLADVEKSREVVYDNPDDAFGLNNSINAARAALTPAPHTQEAPEQP
jgi:hypothetical protein